MHRTVLALTATAALLTGLLATSPPAQASVGAVALNEVESQPRAGEEDWVELVNISGASLSLGGWKVRDLAGNSFTVPAAVGLRAGGRYVVDVGSVLGGEDMLILTDPGGTDVDWFHWTSHADGTWSRCLEGTGSFLDSVPSRGTANPCRGPHITASVSSATPKTANGWYAAPVTVSFTCQAGSAPLVVGCPPAVTLTSTGADQKVTGTVLDTNGASDTVRVTDLDIDRTGPTLAIKGVQNGKKYDTKQTPKVKAADPHSGLAKTKVTQTPKYFPQGTKWYVKARAWDQAGNLTTAKLTYGVKAQQS